MMATSPHRSRPRCLLLLVTAVALILLALPAAAPARNAYVTNLGSTTVSIVDLSTGSVVGTVTPIAGPGPIAITPDGRYVYVSDPDGTSVSVIDTTSNTVVATIVVGDQPNGVAFTPDGSRAYISDEQNNRVVVVSTATHTVITTIGVGDSPHGVAISPDGSRAYVTDTSSYNVSVIDTSTNSVIATVGGGQGADNIAITPDGSRIYVGNVDSHDVSVIDTSTNTPVATIPAATEPDAVAITPDGSRAYLADIGANNLYVIDTATNTVATTVGMGSLQGNVAINPNGNLAFVTTPLLNRLNAISTTNNTIASAFGFGTQPFTIAIPPNQPPVAQVSATAARAGQPTTFDASASTDSDGTILRYDWDFGDGTTLANGGPTPSHTYAYNRSYTATVTETDNEGCSTNFIFTGQTAHCNGSSVARATTSFTVGPYTPRWVWRVIKQRRSKTVRLRFAISDENLNLKETSLLLSKGLRIDKRQVTPCTVTESSDTASGVKQTCKRSSKLGQLYFRYRGSDRVLRRNIYYYDDKGSFDVNRFTTGQNRQTTDSKARSLQVKTIFMKKTGRLRIRLKIDQPTDIERVGISLDGKKLRWLRYTSRLKTRVCGSVKVTDQKGQGFTARECERPLYS